ncbi:protein of unknown function [Shewanella benthica]|uniref:Uncharacterized protein n=1 Tax=Shewanella benthica TaxID=43661 RepID=A0A330M6B5_9GAMM|nr:protein of unknown function [Shewanella benthica]
MSAGVGLLFRLEYPGGFGEKAGVGDMTKQILFRIVCTIVGDTSGYRTYQLTDEIECRYEGA